MAPDQEPIVEEWQRTAAIQPIEWTGDLDDDCTARWAGLTLRAEEMKRADWWWAVYDDRSQTVLGASSDEGVRITTGKKARLAAEQKAREWLTVVFEKVHTVVHYYDGPRRGIADFQGRPHLYVSDFGSAFFLSPIDDDVFCLALEAWAIWRRWESAEVRGMRGMAPEEMLPADRVRHEELRSVLAARLIVDPARSFRASGQFRRREDPEWNGLGLEPFEVSWELIEPAAGSIPDLSAK